MLYLFKLHPSCDVLYGLAQEPEVPFNAKKVHHTLQTNGLMQDYSIYPQTVTRSIIV